MSDITKPAKLDIRQTNVDSGAFADSNPVHEIYGRVGEGTDPRPLKHTEFHEAPWPGPKGRKGK